VGYALCSGMELDGDGAIRAGVEAARAVVRLVEWSGDTNSGNC
jgi:hypothetical protein